MKATGYIPGRSCWFWHRWRLVKDNGVSKYWECADCMARHFRSVGKVTHRSILPGWCTHRPGNRDETQDAGVPAATAGCARQALGGLSVAGRDRKTAVLDESPLREFHL